jgi:hypothetical protein
MGCPREQLANEIEEVEKMFALPGGIGLKSNEDNRRSYLMVGGLNAENADRLIQHAKEGGFGSILMVIGTWADYGRKYVVPERNFPGGLAQLKAVVDKIHAAGMKAGAHMFSTKVPKRSEYTSPKPDPRLYKDLFTQLVQPLDEKADRVVTQEPPADWPRLPGTRDIQVDDEIIEYTELSLTEPFGFTGCKRGMYGTTPAAHKSGASLGHVVTDESRGIFIIDQKTDLLDEVAEHRAHLRRSGVRLDLFRRGGGRAAALVVHREQRAARRHQACAAQADHRSGRRGGAFRLALHHPCGAARLLLALNGQQG